MMNQAQADVTFIGMVAQEKMEVIINDKVTFDYNRSKHQLNIWIPSRVCPRQKALFDPYEINIYNMQHLKQYAAQYFLEHQEKIEEELNKNQLGLSCIPYESHEELTTGYKIFHQDDQVATLEFRSGEWIGAVFPSGSLVTLKNVDQEKVYAWIQLMVLGK